MRRCVALLLALLCGLTIAARAEETFSISDTGYCLILPEGWTVEESGTDPARALLIAGDESVQLYLWLNRQVGWHMSDWKAALVEASQRNSVLTDSIRDEELAGRSFVSYQRELQSAELGDRHYQLYATELDAGVFLTFEFRAAEAETLEERREELEAVVGSLAPEAQ